VSSVRKWIGANRNVDCEVGRIKASNAGRPNEEGGGKKKKKRHERAHVHEANFIDFDTEKQSDFTGKGKRGV